MSELLGTELRAFRGSVALLPLQLALRLQELLQSLLPGQFFEFSFTVLGGKHLRILFLPRVRPIGGSQNWPLGRGQKHIVKRLRQVVRASAPLLDERVGDSALRWASTRLLLGHEELLQLGSALPLVLTLLITLVSIFNSQTQVTAL